MKVSLFDSQKDLPILPDSVHALVASLTAHLKISSNFLIVHFVSSRFLTQMHKKFFNDPTPTDCISFPMDSPKEKTGGPSVLGELFISPKAAINYGKKHQIDPYKETSRYLVHGVLHLLGYDDLTPEDLAVMRRKENACIKHLAKKGHLLKKATISLRN